MLIGPGILYPMPGHTTADTTDRLISKRLERRRGEVQISGFASRASIDHRDRHGLPVVYF